MREKIESDALVSTVHQALRKGHLQQERRHRGKFVEIHRKTQRTVSCNSPSVVKLAAAESGEFLKSQVYLVLTSLLPLLSRYRYAFDSTGN